MKINKSKLLNIYRYKEIIIKLQKGIKVNLELGYTLNIRELYKKQSTKTFLLFSKFFNSFLDIYRICILLNLNSFNFINFFLKKNKKTNLFFINTNKNALIKNKLITKISRISRKKSNKKILKLNKLNKYRRIFVSYIKKYFIKYFKKIFKMITKFNFSKLFNKWFKNINIRNKNIINFNNIYIYCKEIYNSIFYLVQRTSYIYIFKLCNFYKFFKKLFKSFKYQKTNIVKFLYNLKYKFIKNVKVGKFTLILKIIKYFIDIIYNKYNKRLINSLYISNIYNEFINSLNCLKKKFFKKMIYIFNTYTKYNIILKNYSNFSFLLKKKNKKKDVLKKKFNFIYLFNHLINKYIYFIFLYWINLFFKVTLNNNNNNNILYIKKKDFFLHSIYNLYYEKKNKYNIRYKKLQAPKLTYLNYLSTSRFLLYLNKLK